MKNVTINGGVRINWSVISFARTIFIALPLQNASNHLYLMKIASEQNLINFPSGVIRLKCFPTDSIGYRNNPWQCINESISEFCSEIQMAKQNKLTEGDRSRGDQRAVPINAYRAIVIQSTGSLSDTGVYNIEGVYNRRLCTQFVIKIEYLIICVLHILCFLCYDCFLQVYV